MTLAEIRRRGEEERREREARANQARQGEPLLLSPVSSQSSGLPPGPDIDLDDGNKRDYSDEDLDPNDPEPSEGSIYQSDWGTDYGK